ncbi:hypothetical protein PspS35_24435 [Pseudomonas sp. S35]|nr:hypothetical protein PspS35_24435 [Pseudomonas sp. S35]
MRFLACVTRAFLCCFLALSLASASAAIQPWPVAVMPSAMDLAPLVASNRVAWPVTCSVFAFILREGEKTNVLRALLGEDVESLKIAGR